MNPIRYIRKKVFQETQAGFAALAGVSQAAVSRWESGIAPTADDLQRIRAAAVERGIDWNDTWFFEVPGAAAESADAA